MAGTLHKAWVGVGLLIAAALACAQDFTQHGTQPGLAAALEAPDECMGCHGSGLSAGPGFMPHDSWGGSMMSHATRDPLFWAALDVANRDVPGIGDWCLRCHTSQGWYGGRVRKNGQGGFVNGSNGCLLNGDHDDFDSAGNDYSGVTCHTCHRMTPTGPLGQIAPPGSGNVWLDDSLECNGYFGPCRKGPKRYAAASPLEPPHGWEYSAFIPDSSHCGSCHDVSPPVVDGVPLRTLILANGSDSGRAFPAERTYSEWKQSRFGDRFLVDSFEEAGVASPANVQVTSCQDCHMRTSQAVDARACLQNPSGSRRGDLAVHEFVGGNTWVLKLVDALYGTQLQRSGAIARAISWSEEMLSTRSAALQLSLDPLPNASDTLNAHVRITNLAGHKLPTGYGEGRRMWLHFVVRDANGDPVFESGAWDPATGVLDDSPAPKVYEVLQGIWDSGSMQCRTTDGMGRKQFHFALNNCIAKDNRIPPLGFRPATGSDPNGDELRPIGIVYAETAPGSGQLVNYDVTDYAVTIPPGTPRPLQVSATLRYQIASKDYIDFLRDQAVDNAQPSENTMCNRDWDIGPADQSRGEFLHALWSNPTLGRSPPVDMATASAQSAPPTR
jgi:hypothetical protein